MRSNGGGSMNVSPISSVMNVWMTGTHTSGRRALRMQRRSKIV